MKKWEKKHHAFYIIFKKIPPPIYKIHLSFQYPVSLTEIKWLSLAGFLAYAPPIQKPSPTSAPHSSTVSELEEQTLQQSPLHIISLNRIRSVLPAQTLSSLSLSLDRSLFTSNLRLLSAMLLSIPRQFISLSLFFFSNLVDNHLPLQF